ncbi:hypothetical protein Q3G72_032902 [Acer saccharum]|nr:hypothetical protein Q3G72_032902 [Acer saccharum]
MVPGAKKKYNPWPYDWVIVGGDWGSSLHIGGSEFQSYLNLKFPTSDPFDPERVDCYLWVSHAQPVFTVPFPPPFSSPSGLASQRTSPTAPTTFPGLGASTLSKLVLFAVIPLYH